MKKSKIPWGKPRLEINDLVSGSRFSKGGRMSSSFHYICSFIFNYFLRILLNSKLNDNLGGFFCTKRSVLKNLSFNKIFYGYGEYYFILLFYLAKNNAKMLEVPAHYHKRHSGQSKSNFFILLFKYTLQALILKLKFINLKLKK
jgi:dolichol-phosphate mannosyltransferase